MPEYERKALWDFELDHYALAPYFVLIFSSTSTPRGRYSTDTLDTFWLILPSPLTATNASGEHVSNAELQYYFY